MGMAFLANLGGLLFKSFRGACPQTPLEGPKKFSRRFAARKFFGGTFVESYILLTIIPASPFFFLLFPNDKRSQRKEKLALFQFNIG